VKETDLHVGVRLSRGIETVQCRIGSMIKFENFILESCDGFNGWKQVEKKRLYAFILCSLSDSLHHPRKLETATTHEISLYRIQIPSDRSING
jgi:hypothetical protein